MLRCAVRNARAYQLIQVRYHFQRRAGSVAARCGARRVVEFAAQLQERQLRLLPRAPVARRDSLSQRPTAGIVRDGSRRRFRAAVSGAGAQRSSHRNLCNHHARPPPPPAPSAPPPSPPPPSPPLLLPLPHVPPAS